MTSDLLLYILLLTTGQALTANPDTLDHHHILNIPIFTTERERPVPFARNLLYCPAIAAAVRCSLSTSQARTRLWNLHPSSTV
jgi:hypothetical protein